MGDDPQEEMLRQVRETRDRLLPLAASLEDNGIEVADFLEACDQLIAAGEGRSEDQEVDMAKLIGRFTAFVGQLTEYKHLIQQAETIAAVGEIDGLLDVVDKRTRLLRKDGRPESLQVALDLEAVSERARQKIEHGEVPADELEEMHLVSMSHKAELDRRLLYRTIALAIYWESRPPEWWAQLDDKARADLGKMVQDWQEQREELLGSLPLADRRRLENLTEADFDKPETWKP